MWRAVYEDNEASEEQEHGHVQYGHDYCDSPIHRSLDPALETGMDKSTLPKGGMQASIVYVRTTPLLDEDRCESTAYGQKEACNEEVCADS